MGCGRWGVGNGIKTGFHKPPATGHEPFSKTPTLALPEGERDLFMDYSYRRTHVSKKFGRTRGSAPTGKMAESQCSASIPTPELVLDHSFRWGDEGRRSLRLGVA